MNVPQFLIIHHEGQPLDGRPRGTFEQINNYHKSLWNFISSLGYYIGYQYYVNEDGSIHQGRTDTEEGAHTIGYNDKSIGICLAGNFDFQDPTTAQIESLKKLINEKAKQYNIPKDKIVPHRKFANKSCYGTKLSDTWAANFLDNKSEIKQQIKGLLNQIINLIENL